MFYTYVIKSVKSKKLYIGYSSDLKRRIEEHNSGLVSATKSGMPWVLEYYEACTNIESAVVREKQLKTGFGRAYLKRRLI